MKKNSIQFRFLMMFILFVVVLSSFSILAFITTYDRLWSLAMGKYYEIAPCFEVHANPDDMETEIAYKYYEKVAHNKSFIVRLLRSDSWYKYDSIVVSDVKVDQQTINEFGYGYMDILFPSGEQKRLDSDSFFGTIGSFLLPDHERWSNQRIYLTDIPNVTHYTLVLSILDYSQLYRLFSISVSAYIIGMVALIGGLSLFFVQAMRHFVFDPVNKLSKQIENNKYDNPKDLIALETHSELSQIADAFNHVKGLMLESNNKRKTFVEDVSHAIKTPMMTIKLVVDRYLDYPNDLPEDIIEALENIRDLLKREEKALKQLIYISKLDTKEVDEVEPIELTAIVQSVISNLKVIFDIKGIELNFKSPYSITVMSRSDEMSVLIENLLDNAYKHTEEGNTVTVSIMPLGNDRCVMEVADTGSGIDEKDLPLIFDRFHHRDREGSVRGIGLGLSICKAIVDNMGGTIEADSKPGQGTKFTITMPMYSLGV